MGRHSVLGIATRYRLRGSGGRTPVEGEHVQTDPVAHPSLCIWVPGLLPWINLPERGVEHTSPSSAYVKEKIELYLYYLPVPSWQVTG